MGRILAIDYGARRVGLAVTDPMKIIATSLTTVETGNALEFIAKYASENEIERILIGYPLDTRGLPTHATPLVDAFIRKLTAKMKNIPVEKRDETFSSKEAVKTLIASGVKKKKRSNKELIDAVSATIILQEYLQNI